MSLRSPIGTDRCCRPRHRELRVHERVLAAGRDGRGVERKRINELRAARRLVLEDHRCFRALPVSLAADQGSYLLHAATPGDVGNVIT